MIQYALINKETHRVASALEIPESAGLTWHYPTDDYDIVATPVEFTRDYDDYLYDYETGEVTLSPPDPPTVDYTDLSTGETVTMTQAELDDMVAGLVEERVQANVEAIAAEMAERLRAEGLVIPGQGA